MVHRWKNHVDEWLDAIDQSDGSRMKAICYSDLDLNYEATLSDISRFLDVPLPESIRRPARTSSVVAPPEAVTSLQAARSDCEAGVYEFIHRVAGDTIERIQRKSS